MSEAERLSHEVVERGFAFADAGSMRGMLQAAGSLADWPRFAASWDHLVLDAHLPEGHRYRRRRHATLSAAGSSDDFSLERHQPHYQSLDYNPLVGGVERWFEPIDPDIAQGESFRAILRFCLRFFGAMQRGSDWHIECHQFRIEARSDAAGKPTPEGVHRDGVDFVLVLLVNRVNIASGTTTVHDLEGRLLGSFTLTEPLDAALVHDTRVKHGVTDVRPLDPAKPAYRDVLVVTLRDRATVPRR
jgi:hypothetical protein